MLIEFLIVPNGLGHSQRAFSTIQVILDHLPKASIKVITDLNWDSVRAFWSQKKLKSISVEHINITYKPCIPHWDTSFTIIDSRADIFISDNISKVHFKSKKPICILSTNFFWEEKYGIHSDEDFSYLSVWDHIFSNGLLAMPKAAMYSTSQISLSKRTVIKANARLSGLVNLGNMSNQLNSFYNLDNILLAFGQMCLDNRIDSVILDRKYHRMFQSLGIHCIEFDEILNYRIGLSLIRPGLGSLQDVMSDEGVIIPLFETTDLEMVHNARVISEIDSVFPLKLSHQVHRELFDLIPTVKKYGMTVNKSRKYSKFFNGKCLGLQVVDVWKSN